MTKIVLENADTFVAIVGGNTNNDKAIISKYAF